jgi:hypothetical protein
MVAAAAACALGVPTDVAFGGTSSREVARALRTDPVYVAESQRRLLPVPERGRLRLRIAQRDAGRIQVAVVPTQAARGASGLRELANAVDQAMPGRRGALVLTTGTAFHVVTRTRRCTPRSRTGWGSRFSAVGRSENRHEVAAVPTGPVRAPAAASVGTTPTP